MFYYKSIEDKDGLWLVEENYDRAYLLKTESVFAQCNGHFGIRASHELDGISQSRGMFVSGLFQRASGDEVTELVNCPDICAVELYANGERLSLDSAKILSYVRKLKVHTGELYITYTLQLHNGLTIQLQTRRFASRANRYLFCHELNVQLLTGEEASLTVIHGINGQITNSGVSHFKNIECRVYEQKYMRYQGTLKDNGLEIFLADTVSGGTAKENAAFMLKRRSIYKNQTVGLKRNEIFKLMRVCYIREKSDISKETTEEKLELLRHTVSLGYEKLLDEHIKKMNLFWEMSYIKIEGATLQEQTAIAFAQYHLYGMVPEYTNLYSAGAKGLTGEGYKGHVFWDTEIFLLPFFYHEFPRIAKNLLTFRHLGMDGARAKAEEFGFEGAMFPWETAKNGYEETPLYAALNIHTGKANKVWSGIKEHHVTADIVYALMKYLAITNDWEFIESCGAEIVFAAADFWVSRSVERNGRIEILDIIGPDEYNEHIDNNTYTNYMAKYTVESAVYLVEELKKRFSYKEIQSQNSSDLMLRVEKWNNFLQHIFLAQPLADGIIPQDDTFMQKKQLPGIDQYKKAQQKQSVLLDYSRDEVVEMQVLKQADLVMLLNLFPGLFSADIVKKNVLFYESRTLHDSSLSYCAHAQACAVIGEQDMAWGFFEKAMEVDLSDNPCDSTDGIHAASLGGIWNCVIQGFAGLAYENNQLICNPHLPKHWEKLIFQFCFQGNVIKIEMKQDQMKLHANQPFEQPISILIKGKAVWLEQSVTVQFDS